MCDESGVSRGLFSMYPGILLDVRVPVVSVRYAIFVFNTSTSSNVAVILVACLTD
jgi:hypothetical protein